MQPSASFTPASTRTRGHVGHSRQRARRAARQLVLRRLQDVGIILRAGHARQLRHLRNAPTTVGRQLAGSVRAAECLARVSHKFEHETMSTPPLPSPSAERTRRHRQRRQRGARCITVEMNDLEISALVAKGYLPEEARGDSKAIKSAIEALVSDLVFELEQQSFNGSGSRARRPRVCELWDY
jgi:hypothetical protein